MRVKRLVKLVDDFDFFGSFTVPSSCLDFLVGDWEAPVRSLLVLEAATAAVLLSVLLLEGEGAGEDRALCPRSPSTLPFAA